MSNRNYHTLNMHDETFELAQETKQALENLVAQWRKVLKAKNNPQYKKLDELSFSLDWVVRLALYDFYYNKLEGVGEHPEIWKGNPTEKEIEFIRTLRKDYWSD